MLCVSELVPHPDTVKAHEAHMVNLDGAAVVNMIKPRTAPCDLAGLMSCSHEEVDTRMFVHATDGAEHGMNNILLKTGSHLVLALALHSGILTQQLWLKHLATLNVVALRHSVP